MHPVRAKVSVLKCDNTIKSHMPYFHDEMNKNAPTHFL